jgi:hypothetical protein
MSGQYLKRLEAAGVICPETTLWSICWRITDPSRVAEARERLDIIAVSARMVDPSEAGMRP